MARALAAAIVLLLLAASGADGASTEAPKRGGTAVFAANESSPVCKARVEDDSDRLRVECIRAIRKYRLDPEDAHLTQVRSVRLYEQILPSGDYDLSLMSYFAPANLSGLDVADVFACGDPSNFTGYCQRLVARDLEQARRILDQERRARVLNRADAQLARDVPVIPLFQPPLAVYVRSEVRNYFDRFPTAPWNAENWWLDR